MIIADYSVIGSSGNGEIYLPVLVSPNLNNIHVGDPIEDYDAILIRNLTIQSISGKILNFPTPFNKTRVPGDQIDPVTGITTKAVKFQAQATDTIILPQRKNNRRVVVRQSGYFVDNGIRYLDNVEAKVYYYFYANSPVVRIRVWFANRTDNTAIEPSQQDIVSMKFVVPTAANTGTGTQSVLTFAEAKSNYLLGLTNPFSVQNLNSAMIQAGDLKLVVPEFAAKFPKRLVGDASGLTFEILPNTGSVHSLYKSHANADDLYLDVNADQYMPLTTDAQVNLDPAYVIATKAIRPMLPSKRSYTSTQFTNVGSVTAAEMAEAANRWQKMMDVSFDESALTLPVDGTTNGTSGIGTPGYVNALQYRVIDNSGNTHSDLGWQIYGNIGWADGYSYNHYDLGFHSLVGFLRTNNPNGFRLGNETSRYMATYGMFQSKNTASSVYNQYVINHHETSLLSTRAIAKPSHTWSEGLWLQWALTGDDIVYDACLAHRDAAMQYPQNYDFLTTNEGRVVGWTILEAVTAYRYLGDSALLAKAGSYLDWVIAKEQSQAGGGTGVYVEPPYDTWVEHYTQPFVWAGYMMVGVIEYFDEINTQTANYQSTKDFIIRVGKWIRTGNANLTTPGAAAVLQNGTTSAGLYTPLG